MVFNAMSGLLVAFIGAITLYLADSITFAVAAILFTLLKIPHTRVEAAITKKGLKQGMKTYFRELKEGFGIVFGSLMATFLIGSIFANFAIGGALAILPAFADDQGGAEIYGFYLAAMSTGGLIGALLSTWMGKFPVGRFSIFAFLIGAICWVLSALLPWTYVAVVLFGIAWIPIGGTNVIFAATIQSVVPNRILGRINSVSMSMSAVAMPFGSLAGGYFATVTSPTLIFALTGFGIVFISIVWSLHPKLRNLPKAEDMSPESFGLDFAEENTEHAKS